MLIYSKIKYNLFWTWCVLGSICQIFVPLSLLECQFSSINSVRRLSKYMKLMLLMVVAIASLAGCNRKYVQGGDKKKAYKRRYKCKKCTSSDTTWSAQQLAALVAANHSVEY